MFINTNELLLYRKFEYRHTFDSFVWVINNYDKINYEEIKKIVYTCTGEVIQIAVRFGFKGNLWHNFLTYLLISSENSFSMALEMGGSVSGTIKTLALRDFEIFKQLYDFDLSLIDRVLGLNCLTPILSFENSEGSKAILNETVGNALYDLSIALSSTDSAQDFYACMHGFYTKYGAGRFALFKAFKVCLSGEGTEIHPIFKTEELLLSDLVGYELQKKELVKNTEDFLKGYRANNVLLFGDSGTGKSSSIKAILNEYSDRGLRMIEVYKHQLASLQDILQQLRDRNYKFIIYMDDLSFEDFEIEYKHLKAIIEGGLEAHPNNVLLYATSNRRHLIREKWSDKADRDDELHTNDTVQEKLSLASRFGLSILYISPSKKEFNNIVRVLAQKNNISLPEEELLLEANRWEMRHGGLSGRTAHHFINYLKTISAD